MDATPPHNSTSRELLQRSIEAGLQFVPGIGGALAVTFVTAVTWRLNQKREEWLTDLAEGVEELRERLGDIDLDALVSDPRFADAVVLATRTVEHTHQEEKLEALRNAVLNSVSPDAPDADTQAIFMNLIDRLTPSHLRLLTLWNDPAAWFEFYRIPQPDLLGWGPSSRSVTVEAGLPEMRGRRPFWLHVASELIAADLMTDVNLAVNTTPQALMDRLSTELGRQFVHFIAPPAAGNR